MASNIKVLGKILKKKKKKEKKKDDEKKAIGLFCILTRIICKFISRLY